LYSRAGRRRYTVVVSEDGMSPYAKAAAYAGLAFVTPVSGWICFKVGEWLGHRWGLDWLPVTAMVVGCAAGMYETYRQAVRIEGLGKKK
jgi:hypothetical protein